MATVSLDAAMAGGAVIVAVNRMAQSAADRRKDNLIGEKKG
jgi:hypothetical protein